MVQIRSQAELISSLIDFFRVAQPLLDTKPGSVARDLLVEGFSTQLARLYDELSKVSMLQSLRLALGIDLDRLGSNFGLTRLQGSKSTGQAVFTFASLTADFAVNQGDQIFARNGSTFIASNSTTISVVNQTQYKAKAIQLQADLNFVGITDQFAIEVLVEATATGTQGNISKYSLIRTNISGIDNVTNTTAFSGGSGAESDAAYRTRILAVFSGANTGTETGYTNVVKSDPSVIDVLVIGPGDPLMTRDGTQVTVAADGTRTVVSEGTGGKVDLLVYGIRLQETTDTYIYRDLSNTNDPTNQANDFALGQVAADAGKTVTRKRLDDLASNQLPSQPVNNLIQVSGSISGANFVEESVDNLGRSTGNYRLVRDSGAYAGSPWGFDRLHWISSRISNFIEDKTKLTFNGQDTLGYPDVEQINGVTQNISIVNENSKVLASDRSSLLLAHNPISSVTRVFNLTTGERYVVANQNPDGSGTINPSGRVIISGKSLPAISDTLQVDYTWVFSYDPYFDFDNRLTRNNPRLVQDSVDWGLSNAVRRERATLASTGSFVSVTVTHPISTVISVNVFATDTAVIGLSSGRLSVVTTNAVTGVVSVIRTSDGAELWETNKLDGTFSGQTIFLPTDTAGVFGQSVGIVYNAVDIYNTSTSTGSFNGNVITIVPTSVAVAGNIVECNYIANISTILPSTLIPTLPAVRSGNAFNTTVSTNVGCQPTTNILSGGSIVANLRQAPSNLGLTISGSVSPGVITITGTTLFSVFDAVFTSTANGLKIDLSQALRTALKLNSNASIPGNIRLARIVSVQKVTTSPSQDVLSITQSYDIKGYHMLDNSFVKDESVADGTLKVTEFILPSTTTNNSNTPLVGNKLRVSFYYTRTQDSENVSFSKSGTLYTNKRFAIIDTIAVSSGFTSGGSSASSLTVSNLNQPITRSRYKAGYDYLAPKTNERISIRYNFDRLITDLTFSVDKNRPINADVLVKSATPVLADATIKIGVTDAFINSSAIVLQNVQDAVTSALNAQQLNTKVDASDLVNQSYSVNGVDSARVIFFNKTGKTGSVLSIKVQKNEYIQANTVIIQLES